MEICGYGFKIHMAHEDVFASVPKFRRCISIGKCPKRLFEICKNPKERKKN
jgi:hypothetical protein